LGSSFIYFSFRLCTRELTCFYLFPYSFIISLHFYCQCFSFGISCFFIFIVNVNTLLCFEILFYDYLFFPIYLLTFCFVCNFMIIYFVLYICLLFFNDNKKKISRGKLYFIGQLLYNYCPFKEHRIIASISNGQQNRMSNQ